MQIDEKLIDTDGSFEKISHSEVYKNNNKIL